MISDISNNVNYISEGATNIGVNLMIRSIDKIDDVKMEYSVQLTFR